MVPVTDAALVVRTDFAHQPEWEAVRRSVQEPVGPHGFLANVRFVDNVAYEGASVDRLLSQLPRGYEHHVIFVADATTMLHPEHPLLVVDIMIMPGRSFRTIPSGVQSIENNLSIANMDFAEFAESVNADEIFRGFPGP